MYVCRYGSEKDEIDRSKCNMCQFIAWIIQKFVFLYEKTVIAKKLNDTNKSKFEGNRLYFYR